MLLVNYLLKAGRMRNKGNAFTLLSIIRLARCIKEEGTGVKRATKTVSKELWMRQKGTLLIEIHFLIHHIKHSARIVGIECR